MYHIYTRQNRKGKWWCNGTVLGYDYSFEDFTIATAQMQMRRKLEEMGVSAHDVKWQEPEYSKGVNLKNEKVQIGYQKVRIDHNPIA